MKFYDKSGNQINLQEVEKQSVIKLNEVVYYQVINGVCFVYISSSDDIILTPDIYNTIGTIPYHPEISVNFQIHFVGLRSFTGSSCNIDVYGNIRIYVTEKTGYYAGYVSFPIAST